MSRLYLGIAHTFHDSAVALVDDNGDVLFAQGAERDYQSKRALFMIPVNEQMLRRVVLPHMGPDVELVIAYSWKLDLMEREINDWLVQTDVRNIEPPMVASFFVGARTTRMLSYLRVRDHLTRMRAISPTMAPAVRYVDHHITHATFGCFSSRYKEAVCAVIDGMGDGGSTAFYHWTKGNLHRIDDASTDWMPSGSLGFFYTSLCEACNFDAYAGEEWKVMGLSAYGKFDKAIYDVLSPMVTVEDLALRSPYSQQEAFDRWMRLRQQCATRGKGPLAYADLAFTGQRVFEEASKSLLHNLHRRKLSENLVLTGGCALNSLWNGQITAQTGFKSLFVPCAPADDGNALGAAWSAFHADHPDYRPPQRTLSPYLGDQLDDRTLANVISLGGLKPVDLHGAPAHRRAAELLAEGKIIGWVQGRAEFGPRALGNRSILADARVPDIKAVLNAKVKFREEFRPFAPSILHEHGATYFENYQESAYMDRTLRLREEVRRKIPGVVHEDATGRLQSVKREWNERYYDLLAEFYSITGVPMIVNTSFNVMGKPIIHSVEDAIAVYMTTGLDALVIGDTVFEKLPPMTS